MRGLGLSVWLAAIGAGAVAFVALGDEPASEPAPSAVHLVGHEDKLLLDRVQDVIDDWDPRKLRDPYVISIPIGDADGKPRMGRALVRSDLAEFIADVEAAEALGKAFFWEMRAGSDFRRLEDGKTYVGTACASCHYRFGADARNAHTIRIPYAAWDKYNLDPDHPLGYGEKPLPFPVAKKASEPIAKRSDLYAPRARRLPIPPRGEPAENDDEDFDDDEPKTPLSLIVGSQGVEPRIFRGLNPAPATAGGVWLSELSDPRKLKIKVNGKDVGFERFKPEWSMFLENQGDGGKLYRQITSRNSPSIHNSGFSDRLFHDGRAASTFNGISIFGDFDKREVLHVRREGAEPVPVRVAIVKAALASQAVGPIVNEVEMSYAGRSFVDLAKKLLCARILEHQTIADDDSHLSRFKMLSYRELIERAFRREWWDGGTVNGTRRTVPLTLANVPAGQAYPQGEMMEANFSLYWGLSVMLYEASLVSNRSPFDDMMQGQGAAVERLWNDRKQANAVHMDRARTDRPKPSGAEQPRLVHGSEVFQRGFRLFMNRGCIECHSGPLFSEVYSREDARDPETKEPIAHLVERTLLPNSRGDAIAFRYQIERGRVFRQIEDRLMAAARPAPTPKLTRSQARKLTLELDLLREAARGEESRLAALIAARLRGVHLTNAEAEARSIGETLTRFEKRLVLRSGNRHFFTEAERVAFAEGLVEPLFVEKMPIPPNLEPFRRPWPIPGPTAGESYAFYDLGFYNLGVSPPRYDRGVGAWNPPDRPAAAPAPGQARGPAALEGPAPGSQATESDPDKEHLQSSSGSAGSAYRLKSQWRAATPPPSPAKAGAPAPDPAALRALQPPAFENPNDPDAAARFANPRDLSWHRDLPLWDRDFPAAQPPYDSVDTRRADVHFFSTARALVQDEQAWGHREPFLHDNELAFWGSFKTPTLRNVELTGPYMHNGRLLTLHDVVEFYDRGGDLPPHQELNPDKHPAMKRLNMTEEDKIALVFFLACLTDDRVRLEQAPFDHPSIRIVNGYDPNGAERNFEVSASGAGGLKTQPPVFPSPEGR